MPLHNSIVEITTIVEDWDPDHGKFGCRIGCLKYCPQELIARYYQGIRVLPLDIHNQYIDQIPVSQCISYCGFGEPALNPHFIDMIEYACNRGNPVEVCSTLVGLTELQAHRLVKLPIAHFLLHHPDYYHNAKIPLTEEYYRVLKIIEEPGGIEYLRDIRMGGCFVTVYVEDMARHPERMQRKLARRMCDFMKNLNYVLMPNGDMFYCCMTRGLSNKVGNLHETSFNELASRHKEIGKAMSKDPNSICHICPSSYNYYLDKGQQIKNRILSGRTIKELFLGDMVK